METNIIIGLAIGYIVPLCFLFAFADRSEKPMGVILLGIFLGPIIGWIAWGFTLKTSAPEANKRGAQKLASYQSRARESAAIDPVDQWEQTQASATMDRSALPPIRKH